MIHPAPYESTGVSPWRNTRKSSKGNGLDTTAVKSWCGVQYFFLGIILLLPFQFALNVSENADLVVTRILIPAVFFLWLVRAFAKREIWIANRAETWLIISFLFFSALSLVLGLDWEKGLRKFLYLFSIFPIYFVGADLFRDARFKIKAIRTIWISGFLAASVGLVQFALPFFFGLNAMLKIWKNITLFFLGSSFGKLVAANPSWLVSISGDTWMRAFGFFPDPHMFSFFVSLCLFIGLGYFAWEKGASWKILAGLSAVFMFFAIVFSFSRGAYLGVIAGSLFFLVVFLKRSGNLGKAVAVGAAFSVLALIFFQGTVQNRLASAFNPREGSNAERIKNWQQAVEIIKSYPLAGAGLGNYSSYIDPTSDERSSIYAHNVFLDVAAETGLLNGVILLALMAAGIWRGIFSRNMLGLGIASSLVYFFVHGIFDTSLWSPQVLTMLLVILALGIHATKISENRNA